MARLREFPMTTFGSSPVATLPQSFSKGSASASACRTLPPLEARKRKKQRRQALSSRREAVHVRICSVTATAIPNEGLFPGAVAVSYAADDCPLASFGSSQCPESSAALWDKESVSSLALWALLR